MSQWSVDNLKEHFEALRSADKEAIAAALIAVKEENRKTEVAAEKRFDLLNELRQGVATKDQLDALEKLLTTLTDRVTRIEAIKQGSTEMRILIFSVVGVGIAILTFIGFKG
jgi:hypothetical protein